MSTHTLTRTERRKLERATLKQQRKQGHPSVALQSQQARRFTLPIILLFLVFTAAVFAVSSPTVRSWFTRPTPLQLAPNQTAIHLDDGGLAYATDGRITAVHGDSPRHRELIGLQYSEGVVDDTDYHPLLWRSVEMSLKKPDGSVAEVSATRPLWWFEITGAKEGVVVPLDIHEAGISGLATVHKTASLAGKPFQKPTPGYRPVIGTIKHLNAKVLELFFEGAESEPLGVTPNHPLWSEDRQDWIPAGELRIGEAVSTTEASSRLLRRRERPGLHTVHNIEVHRSHSYHVSKLGLLAHNTGLECQRIMSVFHLFMKKNGDDLWAAYDQVLRRMPLLKGQFQLRGQTFKEVLELHLQRSPGTFDLTALRQRLLPGGNPIGGVGSSADIRELTGDAFDAEKFLRDLAPGCQVVTKPGYKGIGVEPPGGGFIGVRYEMSRSPTTNATIDVSLPGLPEIKKIKFNP